MFFRCSRKPSEFTYSSRNSASVPSSLRNRSYRRVLVSFSFVCLTHSAACRLNPSSWPSRTFIRALTSNRVIVIPFHTVRSYYGNRSRLSGPLAFFGLWHEHEFSLGGRALEQLVGAAGLGQRQALGHDRVDLVRTQQLEQREEVLPEPFLVRDGQLLGPVGDHPAAGRGPAPEPYRPRAHRPRVAGSTSTPPRPLSPPPAIVL